MSTRHLTEDVLVPALTELTEAVNNLLLSANEGDGYTIVGTAARATLRDAQTQALAALREAKRP